MTVTECMQYIHKTTWLGSKPGLSRIRELLSSIGNPQSGLRFIHLVGTNGKGSTAAMLSEILRRAGYRVGTFVSPYIVSFNERIQVDGVPIPDGRLAAAVEAIRPAADRMQDPPTEFELITAVGFRYFQECGCDLVVLEAGMGGLLDSTNVIETPLVSVFTAIGLDHCEQLGRTVGEIARTKAGILKPGTAAVFYGEEAEALPVLQEECRKKDIPLVIPDRGRLAVRTCGIGGSVFDYKRLTGVRLALSGLHQVYNAITVIETVFLLEGKGFPVSERALREGLAGVRWPARFELLSEKPTVIFDGAHNINGVTALAANMKTFFDGAKVKVLMGVMADKEHREMLKRIAPFTEFLYTVKPGNPRALAAEALAAEADSCGIPARAVTLDAGGIGAVLREVGEGGTLLIMGSLYLYGDIRPLIEEACAAERENRDEKNEKALE